MDGTMNPSVQQRNEGVPHPRCSVHVIQFVQMRCILVAITSVYISLDLPDRVGYRCSQRLSFSSQPISTFNLVRFTNPIFNSSHHIKMGSTDCTQCGGKPLVGSDGKPVKCPSCG